MTTIPTASVPSSVTVVVDRQGRVTITALPATVNLVLYQGDSFAMDLAVWGDDDSSVPFDLSGATVRAQIRTSPEDTTVAGQFAPSVTGNVIRLTLSSAVSTGLPRQAVWDVDITQAGWVTTLAAGTVSLTAEVSR